MSQAAARRQKWIVSLTGGAAALGTSIVVWAVLWRPAAEISNPPRDWQNASRVAQTDVLRVSVVAVHVSKLKLTSSDQKVIFEAPTPLLTIALHVDNLTQTRELRAPSIGIEASGERPKLSDEHGNKYKELPSPFLPPAGSFPPGQKWGDVLVFEPPVAAAKELRLELPLSLYGASGTVQLKFPTP